MDGKNKEIFENLKIELRSILLSSKDGVSEHLVLSDYEMLSCQHLPYKQLGYKSVSALLRDMPDVAKEIRLSSGEVVYKAVSDESTAHIQRLVGNQKSTKKKRGGVRGGMMRGRGGAIRSRGGRLARGGYSRGSWAPRQALSERGRGGVSDRGFRSRGGGRGFNTNSSSGFTASFNKKNNVMEEEDKENNGGSSFAGRGRGGTTAFRGRGGRGGFGINRNDSGFTGDVRNKGGSFGINRNDSGFTGDVRNKGGSFGINRNDSGFTGDVRNKGTEKLPTTKYDGSDKAGGGDVGYDSWKDIKDFDEGLVVGLENSAKKIQTSPMVNLKIGINRNGERKIEAGSPIKSPHKACSSDNIDAVTPGGQIDLRSWLDHNQKHKSSYAKKMDGNHNHEEFKSNLPPRFRKKKHENMPAVEDAPPQNVAPDSFHSKREEPTLEGQKALCTIASKNWVPPEHGPEYLKTYHKYFSDRGEPSPSINVVPGKYQKRKGFYGRLEHNGTCYFPLEILKSEAEAEQNAARSFCMTYNIPLLSEKKQATEMAMVGSTASTTMGTKVASSCSQPAWMASFTQQIRSSIDMGGPEQHPVSTIQSSTPTNTRPVISSVLPPPKTPPSTPPGAPQPPNTPPSTPPSNSSDTSSASPQQISSPQEKTNSGALHVDAHTATVLENIYKMLRPAGMFVKSLKDVYVKEYSEVLDMEELLPHLQQQTTHFKVEETIKGRPILTPIAGAELPIPPSCQQTAPEIEPAVSVASDTRTEDSDSAHSQIPLLEVGSELEVVVSYAYSLSEIYFQLLQSEDVVCDIANTLFQLCGTSAPAEWKVPGVGSLVAAFYEDGWYRARIISHLDHQLQIYFIDYGNKETLSLSDLRPIPHSELLLSTPPLAQCFALSPQQARHFHSGDVCTQLGELAGQDLTFRVVVLDNSEEACVVELRHPDGTALSLPAGAGVEEKQDVAQTQQQQHEPHLQISRQLSGGTAAANAPGKLCLPDSEFFPVYICQIRTECTVLLRVVDVHYSDALDVLEQQIGENFYQWSVPQEPEVRQVYASMILATADEAEDERSLDQNKYHRVRVVGKTKDGKYTCYLPDHGDEEILERTQLREIDAALNSSLPYQAVMATLHGLDHVEKMLRPAAMKILLKLINFSLPVYAVRQGHTESVEVALIDPNSDDDKDININEAVLAGLDEIREGLVQGRSLEELVQAVCGSGDSGSGSQADSGSVVTGEGADGDGEDLQASLAQLQVKESEEVEARLSRVQNYVDELPVASPGAGVRLYTWDSNSYGDGPATAKKAMPPKRGPSLPSFWPYPFLKSVSLFVTAVESPSQFIAIPLEQQGALEKAEQAMGRHCSHSSTVAEDLNEEGLYAVHSEGNYRRALYLGHVGKLVKVFFPDHQTFDTVDASQVLVLPEQFYSLPFLAYKMRLKDMKPPNSQEWPPETCTWFREKVLHKALYAIIFSQDGAPDDRQVTGATPSCSSNSSSTNNNHHHHLPQALVVRLIDTSGEDDVIVDELMEEEGLAVESR